MSGARFWVGLGTVVALASCGIGAPASAAATAQAERSALREWRGSVADASRAPRAGWLLLDSAEAFERLWRDWGLEGEPPRVDFATELGVALTAHGSVLLPRFRLREGGDLEVLAAATADYLPGFRYVIATLSRAGVASVNGRPLGGAGEPRPSWWPGETRVYDCQGTELVLRSDASEVALLLPGRTLLLPRVKSASGEKYQDGETLFWSKGAEARLELEERRVPDCRRRPAREPWADAELRGIAFRALGQKPAWMLEIEPGATMLLLTEMGAKRTLLPAPDPALDPATGRRSYRVRTEAHELDVTILPAPCADTMSGEAFDFRVLVEVDGVELSGCGRDLAPRRNDRGR